jgi:hypothetical protein
MDYPLEDFRKNFTLSKEKSPSMPDLTLPPTILVVRFSKNYGFPFESEELISQKNN